MNLYKLFSYNLQIHYKASLLSKATLFTVTIITLNILLPFIVASWNRGFWLKSFNYYEQPNVHFTYEYLLVAETEDPSRPLLCGVSPFLSKDDVVLSGWDICTTLEVEEHDVNKDFINEFIDIKVHLVVPADSTITSILLILGLDYRLQTVCPLHMQSLAVITHEFPIPPSGFRYFGDVQFNQRTQLPCSWFWNSVDTRYNTSLFYESTRQPKLLFAVDSMLDTYFKRNVTSYTKSTLKRSKNGHSGTLDMQFSLRVPQSEILYTPSLMAIVTWAWPQYLSLFIVFYVIFERIKKFVFVNRMLMAWEVVPGRNNGKDSIS